MRLGADYGESGEKPSKHERDQLRQLYSHESQVFESKHAGYNQMVTHPATDPVRLGLTWSLHGERQRANRVKVLNNVTTNTSFYQRWFLLFPQGWQTELHYCSGHWETKLEMDKNYYYFSSGS